MSHTTALAWMFWISAGCVFYTYLGYPLLLGLLARIRPAKSSRGQGEPPGPSPVSVVVAAHNEEWCIDRRIRELVRCLATRPGGDELIVVSDGSTDATVTTAQAAIRREAIEAAGVVVEVIALAANVGKAEALNQGVAASRHDIVIFADARQSWADDAIDRMVARFDDPRIGAVSGDLLIESSPGVMAGVGLYWRFEKWIRRAESRFDSMVSVTGSISAVRRSLYRPIPAGLILDDVSWPLAVAREGHRVVHEDGARAFDRLPERTRDEFRRKVRTLAGNYQLIAQRPSVLVPWRNRVWWQFVSHRVLRLVLPWAQLSMLAASAALPGSFYRIVFSAQVGCYALAMAGMRPGIASRSRIAAAAASFLVLNAASWASFWVWISGSSSRAWGKVRYETSTPLAADGHAMAHQRAS